MTSCKNSLAIVSVYDSEGIIDDYLIFFLESLAQVTGRIIVAVNGLLAAESERELRRITEEIYVRQNTGFDFGAYKDVLENYLQPQEIACYNELVLCNDTCFGPFVPFQSIFSKMRSAALKFWSINYLEDRLLPHFQSYFMVFNDEAIQIVLDFLHNEVDTEAEDMVQAHGYEHALSEVILNKGVKTGFYTSDIMEYHKIDIFQAPDYAIRFLGLPVLKKKVLSRDFCQKENCREALRLIAQKGEYPLKYIFKVGDRVYHEDFAKDINISCMSKMQIFEQNCTRREDVIEFCRKHQRIFVYGNGYMSVLFMARFRRYMNTFGGYIVSDEYYKENICRGDRIYPLSVIDIETPVIVAMMRKSSLQIEQKTKNMKNVLFLSIMK